MYSKKQICFKPSKIVHANHISQVSLIQEEKEIILVHCKLGDMRNPRPKYKLIYNLNFWSTLDAGQPEPTPRPCLESTPSKETTMSQHLRWT